jgi:hypothetical protein
MMSMCESRAIYSRWFAGLVTQFWVYPFDIILADSVSGYCRELFSKRRPD